MSDLTEKIYDLAVASDENFNPKQLGIVLNVVEQLEQQNAKLIECLKDIVEYGNHGEDAIAMKKEAQQALKELNK